MLPTVDQVQTAHLTDTITTTKGETHETLY